MNRSTRWHLAVTLASSACLLAAPALPQAADEAERGRKLFEEGQKAMSAKDYATACARFEESYKVSGVPGSLLNWADCEESRNRLATALALWQQGEAKVVRDDERTAFVKKRLAAIEPRVPWLTVKVGAQGLAEVRVEVDGKALDASLKAPLDPGTHALHATAKGVPPEDRSFEIGAGEAKSIEVLTGAVPVVTATASASATAVPSVTVTAAPTVAPTAAPGMSGLTMAGWAVAAVGAAGMIGFGVTGGLVLDRCKGSMQPCHVDAAGQGDVRTLDAVNVAALGVGVAGIAGGVVLLLLGSKAAPSGPAPQTASRALVSHPRVLLDVSPRGAFVGAGLRF